MQFIHMMANHSNTVCWFGVQETFIIITTVCYCCFWGNTEKHCCFWGTCEKNCKFNRTVL